MPTELDLDLFAYRQVDGAHRISAPQQFEGDEEAYDEHIGSAYREDSLRSNLERITRCRGSIYVLANSSIERHT
jgi:hypothetical protein